MKKLILTLLLFCSLAVQGQEYFVRNYDWVVTDKGEEYDIPTKVEFNAFSSTDIVITLDGTEPMRYEQTGDVVEKKIEGMLAQQIEVKIPRTNQYYVLTLFDDGDLVVYNVAKEEAMLFSFSGKQRIFRGLY